MKSNCKIIKLDSKNIATEHICCGFSDKKIEKGTKAKKELIKKRLPEGFTFKKLDVWGKVFIEYVPAENAWSPVIAPGYMFIHCFWVAGRYKGQGYGSQLLNECIKDSKGKNGIVVLTAKKNVPFLTDKKFFIKKGFEVCDTAPPFFELLVKKFKKSAPLPQFKGSAKKGTCDNKRGMTFIYSHQCPFSEYYANIMSGVPRSHGIPVKKILINNKKQAQHAPIPCTVFSVFYNGNFLTQKMLSENGFEKFLKKNRIIK